MLPSRQIFLRLAERSNAIPLVRRLMSDQLTPVLAYRRLVSADDRTAPSFLLESVEGAGGSDGGAIVGRHSFLGAQPAMEVVAREHDVRIIDRRSGRDETTRVDDPLVIMRDLTADVRAAPLRDVAPDLARAMSGGFTGGWVGFAGYDTVRYLEPGKIPFASAPPDDRRLPDMHFGLYRDVAVFDHVAKVLYAVHWVCLDEHASAAEGFERGSAELDAFVDRLETHSVPLPAGSIELESDAVGGSGLGVGAQDDGQVRANFVRADFESAVERSREYIAAGDAFQIVLSQRFERRTTADPFEIYRALRVVNPSPYMIYLQGEGTILVASSPEILCRVSANDDGFRVITRPLAGTRRRGADAETDHALELELRADEKERAEHVMLVDLGRNDLGRVCDLGSIVIDRVMDVERFSHVMHLSSTVSGTLRPELDAWDALRNTLPVGTVSGAPKVRAMQIIDELEPTRRGPYAGGIGYVGFDGAMDVAIALRTLVVPTPDRDDVTWAVHLQAGAGIVADSVPAREYDETVNKAAALNRAIDLAEHAFTR